MLPLVNFLIISYQLWEQINVYNTSLLFLGHNRGAGLPTEPVK